MRTRITLIISLCLGKPALAAQQRTQTAPPVVPVPIAAAWTTEIRSFFSRPNADHLKLAGAFSVLRQLELNDPAVLASLEPVRSQLEQSAAEVLNRINKAPNPSARLDLAIKLKVLDKYPFSKLLSEQTNQRIFNKSRKLGSGLSQSAFNQLIDVENSLEFGPSLLFDGGRAALETERLSLVVQTAWTPTSTKHDNLPKEWRLQPSTRRHKADAGDYLPVFQNEPKPFRRLYVTQSHVDQASRLLAAEPDVAKHPELAFLYYVELRLQGYPKRLREKAKRAIQFVEMTISDDADAIAAYTTEKGEYSRIFIEVNRKVYGTAEYYSIFAHELEHFIQLNDKAYAARKNVDLSWHRYYKEFGAVRAEYEFWKLLPEPLRRRDERVWRKLSDSDNRTHFLGKIQNAKKSHDEFRKISGYSSYEEVQSHYASQDEHLFRRMFK